MLAAYSYKNKIYILKVQTDDHHEFLELLEKNPEFPFPSGEVAFIEGAEVVSCWDPLI